MSGSVAIALQQAIFNALTGDSALTALLATSPFGSPALPAIYDRGPQAEESEDESAFPYVVIGDDTAIEHETDETQGQESTITLHVWTRYRGKREVKLIFDALYAVLHEAQLTISGQLFVYCLWEFSETFEDQDGLTLHGVTRFRVVTMES